MPEWANVVLLRKRLSPKMKGRLFDDAPSDRTEAKQQGANPAAWSGFHCVAHRLARSGFVKFHVDRTGTMRWRIFRKRDMAVVRLGFFQRLIDGMRGIIRIRFVGDWRAAARVVNEEPFL